MMNKTLLLITAIVTLLFLGNLAKASEDVGVTAILSPPESVVLNSQYSLKSVVFNLGTETSTFDVVFTVNVTGAGGYEAADTLTVSDLAAGTIDTVTFGDFFTPVAETTYQVISYTVLAGDEDNGNDTTSIVAETFYGLAIWYGNVSGSPLQVNINSRVDISAYAFTNDDVYVADAHLCLGVDLAYIDSLLSETEGSWLYPFDLWDVATFFEPDFGPPAMPEGFASQSFQGFANIGPPYNAPWLHMTTPTHVLTFAIKTVNDSTVIGSTVNALVRGINRIQGPSNAGDTLGGLGYPVLEHHSPFYFRGAGTVTGQVTDENSQPIENVEVIDLNSLKTTYTNVNGQYTIANLFPGLHDFSFSHPNQRDTVVTDVNIPPNSTITLNVQMEPLPFHDVGVTAILSPPLFVQQNITYPLISEIANMGTATSTFDVIFEAYALGDVIPLVADTFTVTDMPGSSMDTITFDQTLFTSLDTTYELVSYSLLAEDIDATNDTASSTSTIFFGVSAWYGSLDVEPMPANIGDRFELDVYIQTLEDIYLSFIHLCLGTADRYIDSLLSKNEGQLFYPFTEWDIAQFTTPQSSPPNSDGWSSQSFIGYSSIGSTTNPWLHFETPAKALSFMAKVADDPTLVGDTIQCFGTGLHPTFGPSSASDTLVNNSYPVIELFSPLYFRAIGYVAGTVIDVLDQPIEDVYVTAIGSGVEDSTDLNGEYFLDSVDVGIYDILFSHPIYRDTTVYGVEVLLRETTIIDMVLAFPCDFMPGDVNGDRRVIGSDVTYAVGYFRMLNPPPPDSCFNAHDNEWLYSGADANGDCIFIGSDVTYLIYYLRGGPVPTFCPYTPPPSEPPGRIASDIVNEQSKMPIIIPLEPTSTDMEVKR